MDECVDVTAQQTALEREDSPGGENPRKCSWQWDAVVTHWPLLGALFTLERSPKENKMKNSSNRNKMRQVYYSVVVCVCVC